MPDPTFDIADANLNKMQDEDRAFHDWYRFVLSYPPHLVRHYLEKFGAGRETFVLDPFCGTGTTLVEAKKRRVPSIGIEANPVAWLATKAKTDWAVDPDELMRHAETVSLRALEKLSGDGVEDVPFFSLPSAPVTLRTLPPERNALLLKNSISPVVLHKALILREAMDEFQHPEFTPYEHVALARSIVYQSSNLKFGPEVGVGKQKADAPVVEPWLQGVRRMVSDLRERNGLVDALTTVRLGDARRELDQLPEQCIDIVITSPPYPNEKDYTRTTRLELVLLGFIENKEDLRALKQGLIRSNTRGIYKADRDDEWVANHARVQSIADSIEQRRIELKKTSGFERMYPRVTRMYFGGMKRHLASLRRVLRPGARLAYVVGDQASYLQIMIRTGELLAEIAETLGYEIEAIDLFRTRLATATGEQLREEVVVLRWPG